MADQNARLLDLDEIWYSEVCGSLITSPSSKFRNSKRRIQYGGEKYKKRLDLDVTRYSGNSTFINTKKNRSNMVSKIQKVTRFRKKSVLKIPGSKSELKSEIKNKIKKN